MLEPVRYAALKKATMGVFTFSGMTLEGPHSILLASKSVEGGPLATLVNGSENKTTSVVTLESNPCGCLMAVTLAEDFSATEMKATTCGTASSDDQNKCSTEGLSNPASIAHVEPLGGVIIGEDSRNHENNAVWLHQTQSRGMLRIFTAPLKGAVTSVNWLRVPAHGTIVLLIE